MGGEVVTVTGLIEFNNEAGYVGRVVGCERLLKDLWPMFQKVEHVDILRQKLSIQFRVRRMLDKCLHSRKGLHLQMPSRWLSKLGDTEEDLDKFRPEHVSRMLKSRIRYDCNCRRVFEVLRGKLRLMDRFDGKCSNKLSYHIPSHPSCSHQC